ncbi:MAG: c-type cytochrome, partial [Saprospiraceae bacterium]|nr:c-type cytochrome [Saprospiraceae bacterium]
MNKILSFIIVLSLLNSCNYVNYQQGQDLYKTNCATCHMPDGSGVNELYPSLNNLDQNSFNLSEMPCIIRNGLGNELSLIQMSGLE